MRPSELTPEDIDRVRSEDAPGNGDGGGTAMREPEPTETARPGRSRAYWLFGGLFVLIAAALWLSERMERAGSPPDAPPALVDAQPPAVNEGAVAAARAFSDLIENRAYEPGQVADRNGFADGMRRLALRLHAERFRTPPPAAAAAGGDPLADLGPAVTLSQLSIATPEGVPVPPEGRSLWLEVATTEKRERFQLTGFPQLVDLALEEGAVLTVAVSVSVPGLWFWSEDTYERWTEIAQVAASDIRARGPVRLELAGDRPLREGAPVESATLQLGIRSARFEPGAGSGVRTALRAGPADGVAVRKAAPGAAEGWIERVVVPAAGSKTYALVWRDRRDGGAAEARRTDGGPPIGALAPGLPLLAAAADGWTSLAITLASNPRREPAGFLVAAATGDSGAAEALFLEFAAKHMQELTLDGAPLSAAETAGALAWTRRALGLPPELDPALLDRLPPDAAAALRWALAEGAAR
jgi:hypothetical protein